VALIGAHLLPLLLEFRQPGSDPFLETGVVSFGPYARTVPAFEKIA
jgi:hypothetical protein